MNQTIFRNLEWNEQFATVKFAYVPSFQANVDKPVPLPSLQMTSIEQSSNMNTDLLEITTNHFKQYWPIYAVLVLAAVVLWREFYSPPMDNK